MRVDPRAVSGFGADPGAYERGRPGWPAAAVDHAARVLDLGPSSRVVDLAAGTGKLTRLLVPRFGEVTAVEPVPAMLGRLRTEVPGAEAVRGEAEAIPLADASADAVFAAEAFHWFDRERASREIARVLRPGGGLVLLWNRERWDERRLPWLGEVRALLEPHRPAARPGAEGDPRLFEPPARAELDHVHRLDADGFVALASSWSWIARLPGPDRAHLLERIRALLPRDAQLVLPYRAELLVAVRRRMVRA